MLHSEFTEKHVAMLSKDSLQPLKTERVEGKALGRHRKTVTSTAPATIMARDERL